VKRNENRRSPRRAWDAFQYWTGSRDEDYFRRSYLGHYADRDAFGQALLARLGADARLARLSDWCRPTSLRRGGGGARL
jgi:hypothetical protein